MVELLTQNSKKKKTCILKHFEILQTKFYQPLVQIRCVCVMKMIYNKNDLV